MHWHPPLGRAIQLPHLILINFLLWGPTYWGCILTVQSLQVWEPYLTFAPTLLQDGRLGPAAAHWSILSAQNVIISLCNSHVSF